MANGQSGSGVVVDDSPKSGVVVSQPEPSFQEPLIDTLQTRAGYTSVRGPFGLPVPSLPLQSKINTFESVLGESLAREKAQSEEYKAYVKTNYPISAKYAEKPLEPLSPVPLAPPPLTNLMK